MIPLEAARRRRRRLWIREPLSWPLERRVSLLLGAINLSPALAVKCSQTLELPRSVLAGRCAFGSVSARLPHSVWLPIDKRDLCRQQIDRELLRGRRCRGGVDLRRRPTSRRLLRFDPTDLFYPKDKVAFRCKRDRVPNDVWEREGLFQVTTGAIVDYRAPRQIRTS